jgi:hypothetical protein
LIEANQVIFASDQRCRIWLASISNECKRKAKPNTKAFLR